jgi:hypothetical protein
MTRVQRRLSRLRRRLFAVLDEMDAVLAAVCGGRNDLADRRERNLVVAAAALAEALARHKGDGENLGAVGTDPVDANGRRVNAEGGGQEHDHRATD